MLLYKHRQKNQRSTRKLHVIIWCIRIIMISEIRKVDMKTKAIYFPPPHTPKIDDWILQPPQWSIESGLVLHPPIPSGPQSTEEPGHNNVRSASGVDRVNKQILQWRWHKSERTKCTDPLGSKHTDLCQLNGAKKIQFNSCEYLQSNFHAMRFFFFVFFFFWCACV